MTTVVPAEGAVLNRVLESARLSGTDGLTALAHRQLNTALAKTPWGSRHRRLVALVDDGRVLASAEVSDLSGLLADRRVSICGIGSIVPDPAHRSLPHAHTLVESLLAEAATRGFELALIFCRTPCERLARVGFDAIPLTEFELSVVEPPRRGAPMTLVRAGEERDLPAIAAMDQLRAAPFRFHLERSVESIQHAITRKRLLAGLGPSGARELQFFVAEEGITAVAYVVMSVAGLSWTLEECGDRDASGARVGAILQALIARDPGGKRPRIRGWLPHGFLPPQVIASAPASALTMMLGGLGSTTVEPRLAATDVHYWRNDLF